MFSYLNEVKSELAQVTWPKKDQVIRLTLIIFSVSGIFGAFIGLLDFGFTKLLELLVSI